VDSMEIFDLPDDVKAEFFLRSSAGRKGYEHAMAGYCDSGWSNSRLTMELTNLRRYRCLPIYPGLKLGQLAFERLPQPPTVSYRLKGRYNNDQDVQESKGL
jgi:dCTP deaminase